MLPILIAITVSHSYTKPIEPAIAPGPPVQATLTSDDAVRAMLRTHPRVQALALEVRAANRGVDSARSLANPEISLSPGFTAAGTDEELRVTLPLELNGVRAARTGIGAAQRDAVRAKSRLETAELVLRTRLAFAEAIRSSERLKLSQQLLTTAEELDRIARRQVELGTRAGVEQSLTNIELIRAKQQAALAEAEWIAAEADLRSLLGLETSAPLLLSPTDAVPPAPDLAVLVAEALERRPEIGLADSERREQHHEARLARAEGLPDLAPYYRMERFTREPREGGFGVSISIPVFDFGSRKHRIAQAELLAQAHGRRRIGMEAEVRQEVAQALAQLRASDAVLSYFRSGLLDESKKLFESTRLGFQLGQSNITALLEAQRTYRAVQLEYAEALHSQAKAAALLERAAGRLPEDALPPELKRQANPR